jgi:Tol biopolymer transport system component
VLVAILALFVAAAASSASPGVRNGKIAYIPGWVSEGVRLSNPNGSTSRLLVASPVGQCLNVHGCTMDSLSWSPDGTKLTFSREDPTTSPSTRSLFVVDAAGTNEHQLLVCDSVKQVRSFCNTPAWSPDSSRLVIASSDGLYVVGSNGQGLRRLTRRDDYTEGNEDADPVWAPDGSRIVFVRGSVYTIRPDGLGLRRIAGSGGATSAHWLPDGHTIGFTVGGDKVFTVGAGGSRPNLRLTTPGVSDLEFAAWSPDGTRIAYETEHRIGGDSGGFADDVWVMRLDGTHRTRVFHEDCCIDYSPTVIWSPDGTQLAIAAGPGVFLVAPDGTRLHRLPGLNKSGWGYPSIAWQTIR